MSGTNQIKKILVTGATGFIGSHLVLELLTRQYSVRALYRSEKSKEKLVSLFRLYGQEGLLEKIEWVEGDVLCITSLEEAFRDVSVVFHAAAMVSFDRRLAKEIMEINRDGTANAVNLALNGNVEYFLHFSSIAALGGNGPEHTEEDIWTWSKPHTVYAASKFAAEMEVWRGMEEGLNAVIVNPSVVTGPGFWNSGFGETVDKVIRGKIPFYTDGVTGYVDVRDVVKIAVQLMEKEIRGERFIINENNYSFAKILSEIAKYAGKKPPKYFISRWLFNAVRPILNGYSRLTGKGFLIDKTVLNALYDKDYYNHAKIKNRLDYTFIPVEESIKFTVEKYLETFK